MNPSIEELTDRYLRGELSEAEVAILEQRLIANETERAQFRRATRLVANLRAHATEQQSEVAAWSAPQPRVEATLAESLRALLWRWLSWRPLTTAAAGILFGMLCTSMVFGFAARSVENVISLLQENFERGPAPLVTGIPQEVNLWSGDYSEIVEMYEGVKSAQGKKMVRVLRSDFEGKTSSKPSLQGDLMRIVDVRPFLREANGGEVVMTLSARFNAAPFPEAERYDGVVTLYALGQLGSTEESLMEDALALSHGECRSLDRDPGSWQSASTRLLLPTGTEFVMLKVSFRRWPKGSGDQPSLPDLMTFAGHFVDDVRASIRIRNAAPNQQNPALP
jgi:hypothetical protein